MRLQEMDFWALIALVDAEADDGTAAGLQAAHRELTAALSRRSLKRLRRSCGG